MTTLTKDTELPKSTILMDTTKSDAYHLSPFLKEFLDLITRRLPQSIEQSKGLRLFRDQRLAN